MKISGYINTCRLRSNTKFIFPKFFTILQAGIVVPHPMKSDVEVGAYQSGPHIMDDSIPQVSVLWPLKFISYAEDSADLITSYQLGYHIYADDTQLIGSTQISNVLSTIDRLHWCATVSAVGDWCASRRLQLNPSKAEMIWFGSRASLRKIVANDLSLPVGCDVITPVDIVHDLGYTHDAQLTTQQRVN